MKYIVNENKLSKVFDSYMNRYAGPEGFLISKYDKDTYFHKDKSEHPILTYDFKVGSRYGKKTLILSDNFSDELYGLFSDLGYTQFQKWFEDKYKIKVDSFLY